MKVNFKNVLVIFGVFALMALTFNGVQAQDGSDTITIEGTCIEYGVAISTGYMVWMMEDSGDVYNFFMKYNEEPEEGIQLGCALRVEGGVVDMPVEVNYTVLSPIEVCNARPIATPAMGEVDEQWIGEEVEFQTIIRVVEDIDGGKAITVEDWNTPGQMIKTLWVEGQTYHFYRYEEWRPWSTECTPEEGHYIVSIYGVVQNWNDEIVVRALIAG